MTRHRAKAICAAVLAAGLASAAQAQDQACRQALALGLDVSGSVDAREYRLQIDGLISALQAPKVRAALFAMRSAPVELLVYEWSGRDDQHILLEWTPIRANSDLQIVAETLAQVTRRASSPGTAIGEALNFGKAQLEQRSACWRRTLDISGDGTSNLGPDPASVRRDLAQSGITVNALVIGADAPGFGDLRQADIAELSSYYRANVIVGLDAFVQTALGYEAYGDAMARKLERELEGVVVSRLGEMR